MKKQNKSAEVEVAGAAAAVLVKLARMTFAKRSPANLNYRLRCVSRLFATLMAHQQ